MVEEEEAKLIEAVPNEQEDALAAIGQDQEEYGEEEAPKKQTKYPRPLPPLPQVIYEEPKEIPVELTGIGLNKKVCIPLGISLLIF